MKGDHHGKTKKSYKEKSKKNYKEIDLFFYWGREITFPKFDNTASTQRLI
jgi:hypothetical protein